MNERTSLYVAGVLVAVGAFRFATDTLYELDSEYWRAIAGSWLRYAVRAPSDGTLAGALNAQWFKLLSVPCGICLIYLRSRLEGGSALTRERHFRDWAVRGVWIGVFVAGFTVIELHKDFVAGETPWLNHAAHAVSALLAWMLSGALSIASVAERERGAD